VIQMLTVPRTARCTVGPTAVGGRLCNAPAVAGWADGPRHFYECAAHAPAEWERDENGLPLGYYVTVVNGRRVGWLLGPYRTHGEAEGEVDRGRGLAEAADPYAHFYAFGTARAPERGTVFGV
jgi:hypothetical protein